MISPPQALAGKLDKEIGVVPAMAEIAKENAPAIFTNPMFGQLRVVQKDGNPWFVARAVLIALASKARTRKARVMLST